MQPHAKCQTCKGTSGELGVITHMEWCPLSFTNMRPIPGTTTRMSFENNYGKQVPSYFHNIKDTVMPRPPGFELGSKGGRKNRKPTKKNRHRRRNRRSSKKNRRN